MRTTGIDLIVIDLEYKGINPRGTGIQYQETEREITIYSFDAIEESDPIDNVDTCTVYSSGHAFLCKISKDKLFLMIHEFSIEQ